MKDDQGTYYAGTNSMNYQLLESSLVLAKVQLKLGVEGNYLGILWYVLEPLAMFAILLSLRNLVGGGVEHYPLYLLLGLIMFNFFRSSTVASANCVVSNANLITRLTTHTEVFVLAVCFEAIVIHALEIVVFGAAMVYYGVPLTGLVFYPLILLVFGAFICGVSFILSVLGVYVSDIRQVWNAFTRLLWFATPIFYAGQRASMPFDVDAVNPLYYFITLARNLLVYQRDFDAGMFVKITVFSLATMVLGYAAFQRLQPRIAEKL